MKLLSIDGSLFLAGAYETFIFLSDYIESSWGVLMGYQLEYEATIFEVSPFFSFHVPFFLAHRIPFNQLANRHW